MEEDAEELGYLKNSLTPLRRLTEEQTTEANRLYREEGFEAAWNFRHQIESASWTADEEEAINRWIELGRNALTECEPGAAYAYEALRMGLDRGDPHRERQLRLYAWQETILPLRDDTHVKLPEGTRLELSPEHAENLDRFIALAGEDKAWHRLVKAEALRQRGRFDEALALLARPWPRGSATVPHAALSLEDRRDLPAPLTNILCRFARRLTSLAACGDMALRRLHPPPDRTEASDWEDSWM